MVERFVSYDCKLLISVISFVQLVFFSNFRKFAFCVPLPFRSQRTLGLTRMSFSMFRQVVLITGNIIFTMP